MNLTEQRAALLAELNGVQLYCREMIEAADWTECARCWDVQAQIARRLALVEEQEIAEKQNVIV